MVPYTINTSSSCWNYGYDQAN